MSLNIHGKRKKIEVSRLLKEERAIKDMVERGQLYLRKLLQDTDGKAIYWTFMREINERWDDKQNRLEQNENDNRTKHQ